MKVRVVYTTDAPDWWRRAIRRWYGKEGLASRDEIVTWLRMYGSSMDDDLGAQEDRVTKLAHERGIDPGEITSFD